jgi:hypothetical protein
MDISPHVVLCTPRIEYPLLDALVEYRRRVARETVPPRP